MVRQRKYAFFALLTLSVCALALYIHRHRQGRTGYVDNLLISLTGGVQRQGYFFIHGIRTFVDNYFFLVDAKQENERLHREVGALRAQLAASEEAKQENRRLRDALSFRKEISQPLVAASVIGHDVSSNYFGIRVNRGTNDGVKIGMGVISPSGLIGRVHRVTKAYADVLTLIDPTSNVDAVVQRSRARGIISGVGSKGRCKFKYIGRLEDVKVGDVVVSSGFGSIFPSGLLVGYVTAVIPNPSSVTQTVTIRSAVTVNRIEEVFIVFPPDQSEKVS